MKRKLFIVGDSITVYYGQKIGKMLIDDVDVVFKEGQKEALADINNAVGANGGDSTRVLSFVKSQDEDGSLYRLDAYVFNAGLHDIKHNPPTMNYQVEIDLYEKNLREIIAIMRKNGVKPIFVNTTPVCDEVHNTIEPEIKRYNRDVILYNARAEKIMAEEGVDVIDLNGFTLSLDMDLYRDHVHYFEPVCELQAKFVSDRIKEILL